jgi:hypothetical protein
MPAGILRSLKNFFRKKSVYHCRAVVMPDGKIIILSFRDNEPGGIGWRNAPMTAEPKENPNIPIGGTNADRNPKRLSPDRAG